MYYQITKQIINPNNIITTEELYCNIECSSTELHDLIMPKLHNLARICNRAFQLVHNPNKIRFCLQRKQGDNALNTALRIQDTIKAKVSEVNYNIDNINKQTKLVNKKEHKDYPPVEGELVQNYIIHDTELPVTFTDNYIYVL